MNNEQEYRILEGHETLQKGDEFDSLHSPNENWKTIPYKWVGLEFKGNRFYKYRRPILKSVIPIPPETMDAMQQMHGNNQKLLIKVSQLETKVKEMDRVGSIILMSYSEDLKIRGIPLDDAFDNYWNSVKAIRTDGEV